MPLRGIDVLLLRECRRVEGRLVRGVVEVRGERRLDPCLEDEEGNALDEELDGSRPARIRETNSS